MIPTGLGPAGSPAVAGRRSPGDLAVAALVLLWIPVVLVSDRGATLGEQHLLGVGSAALLLGLLLRESALVRLQVAVLVAYAMVVEYTFSVGLGAYEYRLDNVPLFVPPGHGLVYLAALCLGRSAALAAVRGWFVPGTAVVALGYGLYGVTGADRPDAVGLFWAGCLVWFLWRGRAPLVYVAAFGVVTWLELLGTALGTWAWAPIDPVLGVITMGNPPSGVAGAYCYLDAAALTLSPVLRRASCLQEERRRGKTPGTKHSRERHPDASGQ
ncbi:MAG: hypothetical protein M3P95_12120 [Actinomycetota bacterium]|nr:hypothetical protein [Actinomycetota bacterium]